MSKLIVNRKISRIHIVDDNEIYRGTMEDTVTDSDFDPILQDKVEDIDQFFSKVVIGTDAIVTDHHLSKKNYFPINGAQLASISYDKKIPTVLVTKYETYASDIRKYRKKIPVILNPDQFEPDTLIHGLEVCINEFNGKVRDDRKGWRALLRVDSDDDTHIFVLIPAWNPNEIVMLNKADLPDNIIAIAKPDKRLHAVINIGTESSNDLYFTEWEES